MLILTVRPAAMQRGRAWNLREAAVEEPDTPEVENAQPAQ
jgi:hypothetical protein